MLAKKRDRPQQVPRTQTEDGEWMLGEPCWVRWPEKAEGTGSELVEGTICSIHESGKSVSVQDIAKEDETDWIKRHHWSSNLLKRNAGDQNPKECSRNRRNEDDQNPEESRRDRSRSREKQRQTSGSRVESKKREEGRADDEGQADSEPSQGGGAKV